MPEQLILSRLRALDSCALSDAADQLGLEVAVTGLVPRTVRQRIAGRVNTVKLAPGKPPKESPVRHLCTAAIETAEPGDVLVVEQRTGVDAAGWGGVLSNAALTRGIAGAIIEGPARDIDEAYDLSFPVYARSMTCRTARGRIHEAATGVPIQVGGVCVEPGDYVVADSSGAVFIKRQDLTRIVVAAEHLAAREMAMTAEIRSGKPASIVMGAAYEHMLSTK